MPHRFQLVPRMNYTLKTLKISVNVNVCFCFTVLVFETFVQMSPLSSAFVSEAYTLHEKRRKRENFLLSSSSISKFLENPPHGKVALSQFKCSLRAHLYGMKTIMRKRSILPKNPSKSDVAFFVYFRPV